MAPLKLQMHTLLERGLSCGDGRFEGMCRDLLLHEEAFWTFIEVEGVEPTNNSAERAVRKGVLWRKGSFGTKSPEGSRFAERMLTLGATCRQQGRNLLAFLVDTVTAAAFGKPPPRLLEG
jgi:transposase